MKTKIISSFSFSWLYDNTPVHLSISAIYKLYKLVYGFGKAMLKTKTFAKLLAPVLLSAAVIALLAFLGRVHAQSLGVNVNVDWNNGATSCDGTVNGQSQDYYAAISGDSASIHVTNTSSTVTMDISISESGQSTYSTTLAPGGSTTHVMPANSLIELFADGHSGSPCTSGHGGPGYFAVEAASGSVKCSISNNQVWSVSVNYSGIFGNASLYRGGTFVAPFNGIKNDQLGVTEQFSAMTTAATYNLYYGSNNSARLLGSANCPAKTVATTKSSGTTSTPKAKTTTPTTTTTTTPTPTTTNNDSNSTATDKATTDPAKLDIAAKKSQTVPTWAYPASILAVGILGFAVWKFYPKFIKP
jgi:hypothetical protein